jgi:hypothetical protein
VRKPVGTEAVQDVYCDRCGRYLGVNYAWDVCPFLEDCVRTLAERIARLEEDAS